MQLPDYWLTRPQSAPGHEADFDRLLASASGGEIKYQLKAPKWQFLCHAAETAGLALHGSPDPGIATFEPRQADDRSEYGSQVAVYAAADGLWAMFFAIVDREGASITNACIRLMIDGVVGDPHYFFSISRQALARRPWRRGWVYLLPRANFVPQEPLAFGPASVLVAQLASTEPVTPLGRLEVGPEDFPFLHSVLPHDDDRLEEYARALETGAPWPSDREPEVTG